MYIHSFKIDQPQPLKFDQSNLITQNRKPPIT